MNSTAKVEDFVKELSTQLEDAERQILNLQKREARLLQSQLEMVGTVMSDVGAGNKEMGRKLVQLLLYGRDHGAAAASSTVVEFAKTRSPVVAEPIGDGRKGDE